MMRNGCRKEEANRCDNRVEVKSYNHPNFWNNKIMVGNTMQSIHNDEPQKEKLPRRRAKGQKQSGIKPKIYWIYL